MNLFKLFSLHNRISSFNLLSYRNLSLIWTILVSLEYIKYVGPKHYILAKLIFLNLCD